MNYNKLKNAVFISDNLKDHFSVGLAVGFFSSWEEITNYQQSPVVSDFFQNFAFLENEASLTVEENFLFVYDCA